MKIKFTDLPMLPDAVKEAVIEKAAMLYAQKDSFSSSNLGAKYVLVIGKVNYPISENGSVVMPIDMFGDIKFDKSDIVEIER